MEAKSVFWHSTENVGAALDMTRVHWYSVHLRLR